MLIAVLLTGSLAFAHEFEVDGIFYNITSETDLTVEVTYKGSYSNSYSNEYSGQVTIPETVTYNSMTYSVTNIGTSTFSGCSNLTNVTIPNNVTSIGNYTFDNCTSLKELRIEDGESTLSLGYNYYNPSGRGQGLFYDCPLETLYLGRNIKYTDYSSSYPYTSYPEQYGYSAFYNTTTLKSVTIGNSVTSIGEYAFSYCRGLKSVTIGNSVTSIGNQAFYCCSGLTSVTIGNSVTSIGNYAFYNCSGLTCVAIGNSVTSIGYDAFRNCSGLTEVTLGSSVKEIGSSAFYGIERLSKIYSLNPTPPTCAKADVFYNVNKDKCRVYVPVGAGEDYKTTYVWWDFNNIVEKDMSGVESTITDNGVNVVVENGNIVVNGAEDANIEVYSTNGLCVYNGTNTNIAVNTKGMYIVKVNGKSFKVIL